MSRSKTAIGAIEKTLEDADKRRMKHKNAAALTIENNNFAAAISG